MNLGVCKLQSLKRNSGVYLSFYFGYVLKFEDSDLVNMIKYVVVKSQIEIMDVG